MGVDLLQKKMSAILTDDASNDNNQQNYPSLAEFYADKVIGITGGTGFLGQGIIEKLFRCCPDVKKIILFIRNKKNVCPKERLQALTHLPAFDVLRETQPNFAEKLSFIPCDLESRDMGLSQESIKVLHDEVNVIFHCAATLKFNEHLRKSFEVNVQCIRRLMRLARGMVNLKAFIHISTAYCHCNRQKIDEKFYDCGIDYVDLEGSLRWMDDDLITRITPDILGKRPNTYTLTKALAEEAIAREGNHLPMCIVRPSMIIPAFQDPIPGWCTNLYGPTAFFVAYGKGVLRSVIADERIVADLIPVDLVVNGVLGAAMKTACDSDTQWLSVAEERHLKTDHVVGHEGDFSSTNHNSRSHERHPVPIYHFTTGGRNPIHIHELVKYGKEWYDLYPLNPLRLPMLLVTHNKWSHQLQLFARQTLPAFFGDVILTLTNRKPWMLRVSAKIVAGMEVLEYFYTNQWKWGSTNSDTLQQSLTTFDQKTFSSDAKSFDWNEEIKRYVIGTRRFLVKENMNEYSTARIKLKRWKIFNFCMDFGILAAFLGYTGIARFIWKLLFTLKSYIFGFWD